MGALTERLNAEGFRNRGGREFKACTHGFGRCGTSLGPLDPSTRERKKVLRELISLRTG
jgi:hypothetical protein